MTEKVDFTKVPREEVSKTLTARVQQWGDLYTAKNFEAIRGFYYSESLVLPAGQGPAKGPDEALASYSAAQAQGMDKAVWTATDTDVLGPDTAVTVTKWDWHLPDGTKGGTIKDITVWKYHEGDWRIYKEMFNMP